MSKYCWRSPMMTEKSHSQGQNQNQDQSQSQSQSQNLSQDQSHDSGPLDALVAFGVFCVAFCVGALTVNRGLALGDDGNLLLAAQRVLAGQIPFVDFRHYFYSPGRIYAVAGLFGLFGDSYLVTRWMWVVVRALSATLVFLIGARQVPRATAIIPALVVALIPGPWFKSYYALCGLLPLYCALLYHARPSPARVCLLGASTAFALFFRQDMGISATGIAGITILYTNLLDGSRADRVDRLGLNRVRAIRRVLVHLGIFSATIAVLLGPGLYYLHHHGALVPMLKQLFVETPAYTASKAELTLPRMRHLFSSGLIILVLLAGPALTVVAGTVALFRWPLPAAMRFPLFAICTMAAAALVPAYLAFTPIRIFQSYHVAWILFVILAYHGIDRVLRGSEFVKSLHRFLRAAVKGALVALVPLCFVGLFSFTTANTLDPYGITTLRGFPFQLRMRNEIVYVSWKDGAWIFHLRQFVEKNTATDEPVIFLPTYSLLNYICDRPNNTSYINLWTYLYAESEQGLAVERDLLGELRARPVRFIFQVESKRLGEDLEKYLKAEYQELFPIGPLVVLQRKDTL